MPASFDKNKSGPNPDSGMLSVNINPDIAGKINRIAEKRRTKAERLINEILQQYLSEQAPKEKSGPEFLLSLAGMFDSGEKNTSEK